MKGIQTPDEETAAAFNEQVNIASRDLAKYAGDNVRAHISGLVATKTNRNSKN